MDDGLIVDSARLLFAYFIVSYVIILPRPSMLPTSIVLAARRRHRFLSVSAAVIFCDSQIIIIVVVLIVGEIFCFIFGSSWWKPTFSSASFWLFDYFPFFLFYFKPFLYFLFDDQPRVKWTRNHLAASTSYFSFFLLFFFISFCIPTEQRHQLPIGRKHLFSLHLSRVKSHYETACKMADDFFIIISLLFIYEFHFVHSISYEATFFCCFFFSFFLMHPHRIRTDGIKRVHNFPAWRFRFALFYSSPWRQATSSRASMRPFPQTAPMAASFLFFFFNFVKYKTHNTQTHM